MASDVNASCVELIAFFETVLFFKNCFLLCLVTGRDILNKYS